jgi:hypothetical protein
VPVLEWYEAHTGLLRVDGDRPAHRIAAELRRRIDALRLVRTDPVPCWKASSGLKENHHG